MINLLLENKADPSIKAIITDKNKDEITALEIAVKENQPEILGLLLKAGADQTVKGKKDYTPIEQASDAGKWNCVTELLKFPIEDKEVAYKAYSSVLLDAINKNKDEIASSLIEKGAVSNVNSKVTIGNGMKAVHFAIQKKIESYKKDV